MSGISSIGSAGPLLPPPDELETATVAPEPGLPEPAPVVHRGGPGRLAHLFGRGVHQLKGLALDEVQKGHDVDSSFGMGPGFKGHVRLREKVLLPTDPTVQKDSLKKSTTRALTKDGSSIVWAQVHGEMEATGTFGDASGDGVGFPAGTKVGYTLTTPLKYADDGKAQPLKTAGRVLKDQSFDLPVNSAKARALPPGSEFVLEGEIRGGGRVAKGKLKASTDRDRHAKIEVKRLEGEKVAISVTTRVLTKAGASGAHHLGHAVTGSASLTGQAGEEHTERFVLDLKKAQALPTYRALLRGDIETGKLVAAAGKRSGVTCKGGVDKTWTARKLAAGLTTKLGGGFSAGVHVSHEKIAETDARVVKNGLRSSITKAAAEEGRDLQWFAAGGVLEPSYGTRVSVDGFSAGFQAKGLVSYQAIYPGKPGAQSAAIRPDNLPLSADKARALAPGSEVTLRGKGTIVLTGSAGLGESVGVGDASAGVHVDVKGKTSVTADLSVNVRRLEGDRVRVVVSERDTSGRSLGIEAHAGVEVTGETLPGGSVLKEVLGGSLGKSAAKGLAKQIHDLASADASFSRGRETTSREVSAYDLDLSTAAGRAAYDRLVRLDTGEAERAVAAGGGEVQRAGTLAESVETKTREGKVEAFGQSIYKTKAARRERVARLVNAKGTKEIRESEFTHQRRALLKQGSIQWEALQVTDSTHGDPQRLLHLNVKNLKDKWTSHDEVMRVDRFSAAMGAEVKERRVPEDASWWNRVNPRAHGSTQLNADVYFTEDAIDRLGHASREDALAAFGRATAAISGKEGVPGWASPDPKVAAEARRVLQSWDPVQGPDDLESDSPDYYRLTGGRSIESDYRSYQRAKQFAEFVDRAGSADKTEGLRAFADLGQQRDFDFYASVAAIQDLAGDEVVLLNKLELTGGDVAIRTSSEGALAHPDTGVSETFAR